MKQVLHQKRWNSSARCIQYAATIIQLTLEVMQDHLLKAETNEYIGSLLTLLHSSEVHIKVRSGLGVLVLFFGRSASYLLFPSPLLSLSLSPSLPPSLSLSSSLFLSFSLPYRSGGPIQSPRLSAKHRENSSRTLCSTPLL